MRDAAKGWAAKPMPVSDAIIRSSLFPIDLVSKRNTGGGHGVKIRVIDDFRASRADDLLSSEDTAAPQNLDVFFGAEPMCAQLGHARPLEACVADCAREYKHVGITSPRLDFASIALPDPRCTHMVASLRTQPSGPSRAPANCERVANFLQFVLAKLRKVRMCNYVGDSACLEPDRTIEPAITFTRAACAIFWSSV